MQIDIIGIDLGKTVFHMIGMDAHGKVVVRRRMSRPEHFNCFSKLLEALRESSNELADCWFDDGDARYENLNLEFLYPVVVVSGSVQHRDSVDVRERRHVVFRASGVSNQRIVEYLVDVVTEAGFPRYMSMLAQEMKSTAQRAHRRAAIMARSLRRIYGLAKRARSESQIRQLMQLPAVTPAQRSLRT